MYKIGHVSSTQAGKCVICNEVTGNFLEVAEYREDPNFDIQVNSLMRIPTCDKHYNLVSEQKEILIGHAITINKLFKILKNS